jgi:hypothetical protein
MAVVSLNEIKAHLRVDFNDDDDSILQKVSAAQSHIERLLGFKLDDATYPDTDGATYPDTVPAGLRECVLQLAAHWFEHREAVGIGDSAQVIMPLGVEDVVREFRNWSWS